MQATHERRSNIPQQTSLCHRCGLGCVAILLRIFCLIIPAGLELFFGSFLLFQDKRKNNACREYIFGLFAGFLFSWQTKPHVIFDWKKRSWEKEKLSEAISPQVIPLCYCSPTFYFFFLDEKKVTKKNQVFIKFQRKPTDTPATDKKNSHGRTGSRFVQTAFYLLPNAASLLFNEI